MIAVVGFEIVLCHSNVDFVGMAAGGYFGSVYTRLEVRQAPLSGH